MSRSAKIGVGVVVAVFVVALIYSSLQLGQVTVEVCMEFNGRSNCGTAAAPTEEEAIRTATDNACGTISSGVTETIGCSNTPPASVRRLN
jgi:hypothetical protein